MTSETRFTMETPPQQVMGVMSQDVARLTRAWQDGLAALFGGYGDQLRQLTEISTSFFRPGMLDGDELQQIVGRITEATRELTNAQAAVAQEWLRAPFWLTGTASPADLQASYVRLFEASRDLVSAYLEAALNWQRALTAGTERATETVREAVDAQTATARRLANDAREAQQATIDATRSTVSAAQEVTNRAVSQVREAAEEAQQQAERERQREERARQRAEAAAQAERERQREERERQRQREERQREREARERFEQAAREIKGHTNREGEKIYHLPGQANYERAVADIVFEDEAQAEAAGYRAAQR